MENELNQLSVQIKPLMPTVQFEPFGDFKTVILPPF